MPTRLVRSMLALGLLALAGASVAYAQRSARSEDASHVVFRNLGTRPVAVSWVDFEGREVHYAIVPPDGVRHQDTFVGHLWRFRVETQRGAQIGEWRVDRRAGTVQIGDGGFNVQ